MCGFSVAADTQQGFEFKTYLLLKSYRSSVRMQCALKRSPQPEFICFRASWKQPPLFWKFALWKAMGVHSLIKGTLNVLWTRVGLLSRQSLGMRRGISSLYCRFGWITQSRLDKVPSKHRCRNGYQRKLTRCFGSACDATHEKGNGGNETKETCTKTVWCFCTHSLHRMCTCSLSRRQKFSMTDFF